MKMKSVRANQAPYMTKAFKSVRANQAPYMTKALRKAIMIRSSLKNKLHENFTPDNSMAYVIIAVDYTKKKGKSIMRN